MINQPIPTDAQMDLFKGAAARDIQISGTHYKDMAVQPWDVMQTVLSKDEFIGFLKGNVIKYSMRQGKKEGSDDANKAQHYLMKLKEVRGY